jgi:hypothetical protein
MSLAFIWIRVWAEVIEIENQKDYKRFSRRENSVALKASSITIRSMQALQTVLRSKMKSLTR